MSSSKQLTAELFSKYFGLDFQQSCGVPKSDSVARHRQPGVDPNVAAAYQHLLHRMENQRNGHRPEDRAKERLHQQNERKRHTEQHRQKSPCFKFCVHS